MPDQDDYPSLTATTSVPTLTIRPGQTLTLWMGSPGDCQIEIRVRRSGEREIFIDEGSEISVRPFNEWDALDA